MKAKLIANINVKFDEKRCKCDIEMIREALSDKRGVRLECIEANIDCEEEIIIVFKNITTNETMYSTTMDKYFDVKVSY